MTKSVEAANRLVAFLGGQKRTADAIGVAPPTVNAWVSGKHGISPLIAMRAEAVTSGEIKAVELCPKLVEFVPAA